MTPTRLLLDTHALLWWSSDARKLGARTRRLLEDDDTEVIVSAASAWEIATKVRLGKLTWASRTSVESYCVAQRFVLLPMSFAHAERAGAWPQSHGDPFDRMLAAQGDVEGIPIATNDAAIAQFGIETIW